jgi:hypothetical protein
MRRPLSRLRPGVSIRLPIENLEQADVPQRRTARSDASNEVVLRVDSAFAGALMNSNTDVQLVPDWLDRFPFNAMA